MTTNKLLLTPVDAQRRRFLRQAGWAAAGGLSMPLWAQSAYRGDIPGWNLDGVDPLDDQSRSEDEDFWLNGLREVCLAAIGATPIVGGVLSSIGSWFIPSSDTAAAEFWRRMVDTINKIVDEKISSALYELVAKDLEGLSHSLALYRAAIDAGDRTAIASTSIALNLDFTNALPRFRQANQEISLLPLYTVAATLHLSLLRDMAVKGDELGMQGTAVANYKRQLTQCIATYGKHVDATIETAIDRVAKSNTQSSKRHPYNQPLAATLEARGKYQLSIVDTRTLWEWFDADSYPGPALAVLNREVFSPLFGSYFDNTEWCPRDLPYIKPPSSYPVAMEIREYNYIDGLTLRYKTNHGPGGVTEAVIGGQGGRATQLDLRTPIRAVECRYYHAVSGLKFKYDSGNASPLFGHRDGTSPKKYTTSFPGHLLSSVRGFGQAHGYGGVVSGCVFGFQLKNKVAAPLNPFQLETMRRGMPAKLEPFLRTL